MSSPFKDTRFHSSAPSSLLPSYAYVGAAQKDHALEFQRYVRIPRDLKRASKHRESVAPRRLMRGRICHGKSAKSGGRNGNAGGRADDESTNIAARSERQEGLE